MENVITQEDILSYLYRCLPESFQKKPYTFVKETQDIIIGKHRYTYHIRGKEIIIIEKYQNITVRLTPDKKNIKQKPIKSKKGTVKKGKVLIFSTVLILLLAARETGLSVKNPPNITITKEYDDQEKIEVLEVLEDIIENEENLKDFEFKSNAVVNVPIEVTPTDYLGFEKRQRTEELYGNDISFYTNRRGLDYNLVVDLLTRERYNEYDKVPDKVLNDIGHVLFDASKVDVASKMKENVGQLTRAICGEEIIAPVFSNNELVGYDKIFVLPPSYDSYSIDDLEKLSESNLFNEEDQKILKRALQLNKTGEWQIYKRVDAFYNVKENINVSTAYLSYLINKKQDLIKGVMSYNAGYGSVSDSLSYESIFNGSIKNAFDPFYIPKILQYAKFEGGTYNCTIHYQNGEVITYQFQNTRELEYEEKNGHSL